MSLQNSSISTQELTRNSPIDENNANNAYTKTDNKKQGFFSILWNYLKMPKLCDWLITGIIITCVVATIVLISL